MIYYFDSVYVIGGLALLFLILLAFLKFMKRKKKTWIVWLMCLLLCVTSLQAGSFKDVQAASVSSEFTGWKTVNGKKYYCQNGTKLTGLHKIGKYYYGFASDGTMLTGWNYIKKHYR